jgi:hypothetical protein
MPLDGFHPSYTGYAGPEDGEAAPIALGAMLSGEVIAHGPNGEVFVLVTLDRATWEAICTVDEHDGREEEEDRCEAGDDHPRSSGGFRIGSDDDHEPSLGWSGNQLALAAGNRTDLEEQCDDEGTEYFVDREPSLVVADLFTKDFGSSPLAPRAA